MVLRCPSCFREYESDHCPHCGGAQNGSHQLPVGTLIHGRYQIGRVLGQGGFGITYIAWDTLQQQIVAVKEFYPNGVVFRKSDVSASVECASEAMIPHYEYSRDRFLREASALERFRDIPEVIALYDFVKENNTAYIVMEYVRGVDLAKYVQRKGGKLSVEETFRILKPVMEALAKVHKSNIVHRDISPDNIILDPMGGAKLLDFGAVRRVEDPDVNKGLSKSTETILKHGFAPLEQYNTRGSLGPWTDEYAMCATIWYCLTGTVPAEAPIRITDSIDPDWSIIPGLSRHQQLALAKGISSHAKERYPSMDALLADLFSEQEGSIPVKCPSAPSRMRYAMIGAAAAVVIITGVFFLSKKQEAPPPPETHPTAEASQTEPPAPSSPTSNETTTSTETTVPSTASLTQEEKDYLHAEQLLEEGKLGEAAVAFGKLAYYSDARERSLEIWDKIAVRETLSAGQEYIVGIDSNGTIRSIGFKISGLPQVRDWTDPEDIIAVSVGFDHAAALYSDGTVKHAGSLAHARDEVSTWSDIVAIDTGNYHTVGIRIDGTVIAAGSNGFGQCDVGSWSDIVAVSTGELCTIGLRADGTVVATGAVTLNEMLSEVRGWTDIIAISAGSNHIVGLTKDNTVVAAGSNEFGECDVDGWTDIIAISAGEKHTVGLKKDGTAVATGKNNDNQINVTHEGWRNICAVSAGGYYTLGLTTNGQVLLEGSCEHDRGIATTWDNIRIPGRRIVPFR